MQEISPLPDAIGDLAIAPTEPLAPVRPSSVSRKWMAAIIASCLFHAALAAAFLITPGGTFDFGDATKAEGIDQTGADVVGNALDGQVQGAMNVSLVPDPRPAKPKPAKPEPQPEQPAREVAPQPPAPLPQAVKQTTAAPDILVTETPRPDAQSVAPKVETPVQPAAPTESAQTPQAEPWQPPIPTARPSLMAGLPGKSDTDLKRGAADGQERNAAIASRGRKKTDAGQAAASRYTSEIYKKLARANRKISKSAQAKAKNNTIVKFLVTADGNITDLLLTKSSGSPELDQFVLTLMRKAAPFPPIPPETRTSVWPVDVEIGPF